jgi:hypothetical protein
VKRLDRNAFLGILAQLSLDQHPERSSGSHVCRGVAGFMKLPTRFSLASLFFLVTLTAFGTVAYQYLTVSGHYKRNHDAKSIRYLLSRRIKTGDSLERVVSLLGPGELDDGSNLAYKMEWQAGPHDNQYVVPALYPDGFREGDLFINFVAKPYNPYALQFRNGRLVNHDPTQFFGEDTREEW